MKDLGLTIMLLVLFVNIIMNDNKITKLQKEVYQITNDKEVNQDIAPIDSEYTIKHEREFIIKRLEIPFCNELIKAIEKKSINPMDDQCVYEEQGRSFNSDYCLDLYDKLERECDFNYWDYHNLLHYHKS